MPAATATAPATATSLVVRIAQRYEVEPAKLLSTLKSTVFRTDKPISDEQMMTLLVVAEQYRLNPFTRELFALVDKHGNVIPYVSVDGWARIINEHPQFDGMRFKYEPGTNVVAEAMTCIIFRKDRAHPTEVTELMRECKRTSIPWQVSPVRMLRHKSLIQCARLAFGFAGIHDEDEARRIVRMGDVERVDADGVIESDPMAQAKAAIRERAAARRPKPLTYAELADQLKRCTTTASASAVLAMAAHLPDDQLDELRTLAATLELDPVPQRDPVDPFHDDASHDAPQGSE